MKLKNYNVKENELHPYHLVKPSPWPMTVSFGLFFFLMGLVKWFHSLDYALLFLHIGILGLSFSIYFWFRDIIFEATYEQHHTKKVRAGIRLGMKLFIVSEIMFFFSFFLSYFYIAFSPTVAIGCSWPPEGIIPIHPGGLPLVNTCLLIGSGVTVTWAHRAVVADLRRDSINALGITIFLGLIFTYFQYLEYNHASFAINDSVYGSLFYIMTGFHGIHVIIGTAFLIVCWFRLAAYHFTSRTHTGLVLAIWYWHFVDVVWIALYGLVYIYPYYNNNSWIS